MNKKGTSRVNTLLRKERLLQGWSQQDLADRLGITIVTVNRWERGSQQPSPMFRLKLCQLFDKSEEELGLCDEETTTDPASSEIPEPKNGLMNAPGAEKQKVQQAPDLSPAVLLDQSFLHEESNPTLAAPLASTDTPFQHPPVFQTTPHFKGLASEAYASLAQAKHGALKYHFPLLRRMLPLAVLFTLILASTILLPRWSSSLFSPQTIASLHTASLTQPLASRKVLYQAQWSKDRGGWIASSYWHWSDQDGGMIITDSGTNSIMLAPYQVSTASYAIEASIQRTSYSGLPGEASGIVVGMTREKGVVCGFGLGFPEQHEHFFIDQLATPTTQRQPHIAVDVFHSPPINLDEQWHTYRVEVTLNHLRFFSDNKLIGQVINDEHIQGGQVGIYAVGVFIHIRSFTVFAL